MVKICEVVDGCEDCPKYGDDCDGDKMTEHTDYISRADAIEAVRNEYEAEFTDLPDIPRYYYEKVVGKMAHEINMLREQLESADAEPINCVKCKHYYETEDDTDVHGHCRIDTAHTDLISRADAIEAVAQQWLFEASVGNPYVNDDDIGEYRKIAEALFEDVPSADAKQGKWIEKYNGNGWNDFWDYTCSNCGKKYERADAVLYHANYCPNCGARMTPYKGGAE